VSAPEVVELTADQTHPLRLAVLRHDTPTKQVEFPEDSLPDTWHLGLRVDGEVVATSSWVVRAYADEPAVQLRGMATARSLQGTGLGRVLLDAGCARVAASGVHVVWARARDAALGFYQRNGFEVVGEGFIDEATQLPHHVVIRRLR
jgi:predicted GNAT family N-acyltransferase